MFSLYELLYGCGSGHSHRKPATAFPQVTGRFSLVGDRGFEPLPPSVSRKRGADRRRPIVPLSSPFLPWPIPMATPYRVRSSGFRGVWDVVVVLLLFWRAHSSEVETRAFDLLPPTDVWEATHRHAARSFKCTPVRSHRRTIGRMRPADSRRPPPERTERGPFCVGLSTSHV